MKRNLWALLICVPVVLLSLNLSADTVNTDQASVVMNDVEQDTMNAPQGELNLSEGATDAHRRWGWGRWGGWGGWWGGYSWPYYGYGYGWPYYGYSWWW